MSDSDPRAKGDFPFGLHRVELGQDPARVRRERGQHFTVTATQAGCCGDLPPKGLSVTACTCGGGGRSAQPAADSRPLPAPGHAGSETSPRNAPITSPHGGVGGGLSPAPAASLSLQEELTEIVPTSGRGGSDPLGVPVSGSGSSAPPCHPPGQAGSGRERSLCDPPDPEVGQGPRFLTPALRELVWV